jgi:hypothetical protein
MIRRPATTSTGSMRYRPTRTGRPTKWSITSKRRSQITHATFIGTTNSGVSSVTYLVESNAQANPVCLPLRRAVPTPTNLGNCWHHPYNYEPPGAYMRNPRKPLFEQHGFTFTTANQFQGSGTPGNQTGGNAFIIGG